MSKCLNCEKEIKATEGKREKKFCSDKCRVAHFQKNKKGEGKYVLMSTHKKVLEELEFLKKERNNTFTNAARGRDESGVNEDELRQSEKKGQNKAQKSPISKKDKETSAKVVDIAATGLKQGNAVNVQNLNDVEKSNYSINTLNHEEIKAKIEELTTQMKFCGTGSLGVKTRNNLQSEINNLQNQLK